MQLNHLSLISIYLQNVSLNDIKEYIYFVKGIGSTRGANFKSSFSPYFKYRTDPDKKEYSPTFSKIIQSKEDIPLYKKLLLNSKRHFYTQNYQYSLFEAVLALEIVIHDFYEKKYRELFESSKDGIVSVSMNQEFLEANQSFQEMTGYSMEELKKITTQDLWPKYLHTYVASVRDKALERGYSDELELELIRKDGKVFPVSIMVWRILDDGGKPVGIWGRSERHIVRFQ